MRALVPPTSASSAIKRPLAGQRNPPLLEACAEARRCHLAHAGALVEPGSCFAGMLAELVFASDRSYMLIGEFEGDNRPGALITLTEGNFGPYPMSERPDPSGNALSSASPRASMPPKNRAKRSRRDANELGLVTFALDDIDWDDEVRVFLEERASFSPDALTGMEANLRFAGPETMERKSSAASPPGRTGSSSGPTRSARTARCSATAPACAATTTCAASKPSNNHVSRKGSRP
jgi:hypothetical protein